MDATLQAVVIGSGLTFIAGAMNSIFDLIKTNKQNARLDSLEMSKRDFEIADRRIAEVKLEEEEKLERKRLIYRNILMNMFVVEAMRDVYPPDITEERRIQVRDAFHSALEWLAALIYETPNIMENQRFRSEYERFIQSNGRDDSLRNIVLNILRSENNGVKETESKPGTRRFYFELDREFINREFIKGSTVSTGHTLSLNVYAASPSQREILIKHYPQIFSEEVKLITHQLIVPKFDVESKRIMYTDNWMATVNPKTHSSQEVLDAWEKSYVFLKREAETQISLISSQSAPQ